MTDEPQNPREIKRPLTLRITAAEVVESQLEEDDLRALRAARPIGGGEVEGRCEKVYCEGGYSNDALEA